MVVWFEGFGSIWFRHEGVSELLVFSMFDGLYVIELRSHVAIFISRFTLKPAWNAH